MLRIKVETESGTKYKDVVVIDSHCHMGKDVDGVEMMNPLAPGSGTFDFWAQVQSLVEQEWEKTGEQNFMTTINGKTHVLSFEFAQMPFLKKILEHLEEIQDPSYKDMNSRFEKQQLIDQACIFPFQDVFRDKMPEASYRASNTNIMRFTTRFPFSLRLIGYMRCDPQQGERAVREVDYGVQIGARGLKLHPRSEGWIDHIYGPDAVKVLVRATQYYLPVILDTRGKQSIFDIGELIKNTRNYLQNHHPELVPHLKVIIAHCAQGNVGDYDVYNTICQPNTWGELSMLHGKGAENFFKDFRNWYNSTGMQQRTGKRWSENLLYGSDFPYFGPKHAFGLIYYLMNKEFFDSGGTLEDMQNIMGLNQLKLLPEYSAPYLEHNSVPGISSLINSPNPELPSTDVAIKAIANLLNSGLMEIEKILFQFDGNYSNYKGEVLLATKAKRKQDQIINLVVMNLVKDKLAMISTLSKNSHWKQFGFKYFDPEDREFLHSVFQQSKSVTDGQSAYEVIKQIY
ncbi:MAG: amidohydrolase family protein [Candidatus Lokiarchaeota archaeon]|nr:amidohydrolase family protein [Candidatus Lokiarchaeota archaeon]